MRIISSFLIFLALLSGKAFGAGVPLSIASAALAAKMLAYSGLVASFKDKPCLEDSSKDHLDELQKNIAAAQAATLGESQDLMKFIIKPMQGDGTCNGGFQAIALESQKRAERIAQSMDKMNKIAAALAQGSADNLIDAEMIMNADDEECFQKAWKQNNELESTVKNLGSDFQNVQDSLGFELGRFEQFRIANTEQAQRCGDKEFKTAAVVFQPNKGNIKDSRGANRNASGITSSDKSKNIKAGTSNEEVPGSIKNISGISPLRNPSSKDEIIEAPNLGSNPSYAKKDPAVTKAEIVQNFSQVTRKKRIRIDEGGGGKALEELVGKLDDQPPEQNGLIGSEQKIASTSPDSPINDTTSYPTREASPMGSTEISPAEIDIFQLVHARIVKTGFR